MLTISVLPLFASLLGTCQAKQKLRRQTDEAIQHGVFGVPAMVVDDEVFWGVDAIPFVGMPMAASRS